MKIHIAILLFCLAGVHTLGQQSPEPRIPMIGERAPAFTAESTQGTIRFPDDNNSKWTILFSHPADFTAVCSSELLELAAMQDDFNKLNARLFVISTDAVSSHIEWTRSLESVNYKDRPTAKIRFPLISDKNLEISGKYGMIHPGSNPSKDIRGVFIISPDDKIQGIYFYPMNVGRNLDEIKRTLIAMQTAERNNVLIPANWEPGQDVMVPSPKTKGEADEMEGKKTPGMYSITWYMWFKKP